MEAVPHKQGESTSPHGRGPTIGPLTRRWKESLNEPPTPYHVRIVCEAFGLDPDGSSIPDERKQTLADLLCWRAEVQACGGGLDWFREVGERVDPKPRRVELSGPGGGPVRAALGHASEGERLAAENYYESLSSG